MTGRHRRDSDSQQWTVDLQGGIDSDGSLTYAGSHDRSREAGHGSLPLLNEDDGTLTLDEPMIKPLARCRLRPLLLVSVLATLTLSGAAMTVTNLGCEQRINPMGVDVVQPRLSWILQSSKRGDRQTAYRILAASSRASLDRDTGDLWDSGRVASDETIQVPFAGKPLKSSQEVFWKVRVWDPSGTASPWSTTATWTMGVLNTNEWQAQWVSLGNADSGSTFLRRNFPVRARLTRALIYISGLGQYELSFNGSRVGSDLLSPGWTKYDKTILYDTFDVTALLTAGTNAIGIVLGNGMYNVPTTSRYAKFTGTFGPRKVIAQIRLEYGDTITNIFTDLNWKATTNGPITFDTVFGGEDYDARLEPRGWNQAGFDDSAWERVTVANSSGGELRGLSCSAPPLRAF